MFEDLDIKLKKWAKFLFIFLLIASIALAIITGWQEEVSYSYSGRVYVEKVFHLEYFLAFLIGGPIDAYIVSAVIYGIGEILSNQEIIKSAVHKGEFELEPENYPTIGFKK